MRCERCAGLVVAEHGSGGTGSTGCWVYGEWRCIDCGAMGISVPASAPPVARGVAGNEKGSGPRHILNTEFRR